MDHIKIRLVKNICLLIYLLNVHSKRNIKNIKTIIAKFCCDCFYVVFQYVNYYENDYIFMHHHIIVSCNQTYKDGDICDMSISELQDKIKGVGPDKQLMHIRRAYLNFNTIYHY